MLISVMTGTPKSQEILIPIALIVEIEKNIGSDDVYPHRVWWRRAARDGEAEGVVSGLTSDSELQSMRLQSGLAGALRYPPNKGETRHGFPVVDRLLLTSGQQVDVIEDGRDLGFALPDGSLTGASCFILDEVGQNEEARIDARMEARRRSAKQAKSVADVSAEAAIAARAALVKKAANEPL
ncbi:MAG TPA: hypothetical protein VIU82_01830 [Bosea sp. (in: a-proteobacteria)]